MIRLINLRALCATRGWGPAELGRATGRKTSQCSDMLRGDKSFGEKIARSFEDKLSLPRGWLDVPHDKAEMASMEESGVVARSPNAPYLVVRNTGKDPELAEVSTPANPLIEGVLPIFPHNGPGISARTAGQAPVVSWSRLGDDLHKSAAELDTTHYRFYNAPTEVSDKAKWVRVHGNELGPELIRDDWVLFDPANTTPKRDAVVLLLSMDHDYIIRRFRPLPDGDFEVYDAAGRTMVGSRHGLTVAATAVTMQRDSF